ncbi:MAG: 4-alpha-glucanotransferase [Bacteroidales bacterium]
MPIDVSCGRHAGLLVPLFSIPSTRSWGIGEITDIPLLASWLRDAGLDLLQVLPINEMAPGQKSPYSAITAMAIDPIFISLSAVPEFEASGGEQSMDAEERATLDRVRAASRVQHDAVRHLKNRALRRAFDRFMEEGHGARSAALDLYVAEQRWWLDDYALFRTLHARHDDQWWRDWPDDLQRRDEAAMRRVREEMAREIRYHQYVQWLADRQWHQARAQAGVALFGDLPFMVDLDSADVWAHQDLFDLDATVGVPPDAFSETGQDWGLPVYRWDEMAARDDLWLRERARRSAALYDGYRVDHLVGFYRTYVIPRDGGKRRFRPEGEAAQTAQGERVLAVFGGEGSRIIAEDLGTVPDFVRASLARLGVPGYKVFRWEREWKEPGKPFRAPAAYPPASVATSGTHDTDPMAIWWETAPEEERVEVARLSAVQSRVGDTDLADAPFTPDLRDALLEVLFASGSDFLLLPIQDVFGWRDRINVPATVTDENWTYRLPWPVEKLRDQPEAEERARRLARWASKYQRGAVAHGEG